MPRYRWLWVIVGLVAGTACGKALREDAALPRDTTVVGAWVRTSRGFHVRGYVRTDSGSIVVGASVANRGSAAVQVTLEGCRTGARASASPTSRRVLWTAEEPGCVLPLIVRTLPPGDTMPADFWQQRFPITAVLGDSLPEGRYHFAVSPPVNARNWDTTAAGVIPGGRVFVPVGRVWLSRDAGQ